MSDVLYIQINQNIKVTDPHVRLEDIGSLVCSNQEAMVSLRTLPVINLPSGEPGRYVMDAMEVIEKIQRHNPRIDVTHIGEPSFILTYVTENKKNRRIQWIKVLLVCLIAFFGSAFSIMTFNTDVDTTGLFGEIYQLVTGKASQGTTILEYAYSVGIGVGVIFYFNHFGRKKLTQDPTPMEVKMRLYEQDVNTAVLEEKNRKGEQ